MNADTISSEGLALMSGASLADIRRWTKQGLLPQPTGERPEHCTRGCRWPKCTYLDCPGPCWTEEDYADQRAYFEAGGK